MLKPIKVAVVGGRNFSSYQLMLKSLDKVRDKLIAKGRRMGTIVSGGAIGADKLGERYAKENGFEVEIYLPDWDTHGKSAGFRRNKQIVEAADMVIAFWDEKSKGTASTIQLGLDARKPVIVINY